MVDVTPDKIADEVEQLADALYYTVAERRRDDRVPPVHRFETRALARAAAAVGARTALEDAAAQIIRNGPVMNYELNYDGSEDPMRAAYVEGQHDAWSVVDELVRATYTTDEEAKA